MFLSSSILFNNQLREPLVVPLRSNRIELMLALDLKLGLSIKKLMLYLKLEWAGSNVEPALNKILPGSKF